MGNSMTIVPLEREDRCTIPSCVDPAHYDVTVIGEENQEPMTMPFCLLHAKHMIDQLLAAGERDWARGNYP